MRGRRVFGTIVLLALLLLAACSGDTSAPEPTPTPEAYATPIFAQPVHAPIAEVPPDASFVIPDAVPTPVPKRLNVTSPCKGKDCNGTDPGKTGCEEGAYTQTSVSVKDAQGRHVATLELRGNHTGCDSTQWARVVDLSGLMTFALRVRQCDTGLATEWREFENRREDAWSVQMHSPERCVRAEFAVPDGSGGWRVVAFTDAY